MVSVEKFVSVSASNYDPKLISWVCDSIMDIVDIIKILLDIVNHNIKQYLLFILFIFSYSL